MKYLVLSSGGIDSTVAAYHAATCGHKVGFLFTDYGQLNIRAEETAQDEVVRHFSRTSPTAMVESFQVSLTSWGWQLQSSSLIHEEGESTVVNGRNMVLASVAASLAYENKYDGIALGIIGGDNDFPDCKPRIWEELETIFQQTLGDKDFDVWTPFTHFSKAAVIELGADEGAPLDLTWSCYSSNWRVHCGKCFACRERKRAFKEAGVADPTEYVEELVAEGLEQIVQGFEELKNERTP